MIVIIRPTPDLMTLLDEVDAGHVVEGCDQWAHGHTWLGGACVDLPMVDAAAAGWVRLGHDQHTWRLTDAGETVHAAHATARADQFADLLGIDDDDPDRGRP